MCQGWASDKAYTAKFLSIRSTVAFEKSAYELFQYQNKFLFITKSYSGLKLTYKNHFGYSKS